MSARSNPRCRTDAERGGCPASGELPVSHVPGDRRVFGTWIYDMSFWDWHGQESGPEAPMPGFDPTNEPFSRHQRIPKRILECTLPKVSNSAEYPFRRVRGEARPWQTSTSSGWGCFLDNRFPAYTTRLLSRYAFGIAAAKRNRLMPIRFAASFYLMAPTIRANWRKITSTTS